ncbi:polyphosphate--nucleotide phosphotransferase [Pedobacter sp. Leaf41]|jgi:PPK2 family polyphosphate:nucleotide phosphotransferase|uniref:polyphosphate kinase 2 family protein n=1 Tax=Pedobacter sp. Leaf41 TaxID=1736218 RepID=UPI000702719A|nr:polyphosphate kinase 2 family protein [Pedobacter sp. Leaf41]KQN38863.1 polyphosphate--nucleotide phosphotransferase [Pedobacter sp. Leaf41]RZL34786.1 MAG: polyphosphate kinase 2 family protein [Pedobacter sp.]
MKNEFKELIVQGDKKFSIKSAKTDFTGGYNKETAKDALINSKIEVNHLQEKLYASATHSILIIFQAMDAAGKDSAIEHVMSGLNPQGCQVFSFKVPTSEEYKHDFLWRHIKALPERGRIGIHNRSHYENVLVCKVHPKYILSESLPGFDEVKKINKNFWKKRYESIKNFEEHLAANGTVVLKFFLNVSKDEQKQRFLDRIEDPTKNWKFSSGDIEERALWDEYMKAYEDAINETSTKESPWHIIPADKKWFARLAISEIVADKLKSLNIKFPVLDEVEQGKLMETKTALLSE